MDSESDNRLISMFLIFVISFVIFAVFVIFNKPIAKLTQAKEELLPSSDKSLIFVWPLDLPANGEDNSEVKVFIRNLKGRGISDKKVILKSNLGSITPQSAITDNQGAVIFSLTSNTAGIAEIQAVVDNITVDQIVTVKFN